MLFVNLIVEKALNRAEYKKRIHVHNKKFG